MASISISSASCHNNLVLSSRSKSRMLISTIVCCQNHDPNDPLGRKRRGEGKEEKKGAILQRVMGGVEKLGMGLKENLSPKRKGDWKDITLMSLSFAVYVYMSQKIVCAYCAWMSMAGQPW